MTTQPVQLTIDGQPVEVMPGQTVLDAARKIGLDIPTLCYLEKCGPLNTCLVCLVKVNGKLVPSCGLKAEKGMAVESETAEVHDARRTALELLFSDHVGDCLSPCQRLCPLGLNIPSLLRQISGDQLTDAVANVRGALPLPAVLGRLCHHPCEQGCRRGNWDDPAAIRELERYIGDLDLGINPAGTASASSPDSSASPPALAGASSTSSPDELAESRRAKAAQAHGAKYIPPNKAATGKSVVIIGAGPTGLAASYYLARQGHHVMVVDRHEVAGGSLRNVAADQLPTDVLLAEVDVLRRMGVEFKLGVELGHHVRVDGLARAHDAILLTIGEVTAAEAEQMGVPLAGPSIKTDPNTCQTPLARVFAAGSAVRPIKQLVRAMGEGKAAAECVHRFLGGFAPRRPEKVFSSIMGRLNPGELRQFLVSSHSGPTVSPCDRCAGFNRKEAAIESSRCMHCDCRSSGNCAFQHYAQVYGADASRYRSERREFKQDIQPCGVIFEQGKCILCGICVKITEQAREPLGLTFIGRGFDVRIAAPFNATIEEGMQRVAEECVKYCPTGALSFDEKKRGSNPACKAGGAAVEG